MATVSTRNVLVLLSTAGGGDRQPVISLAVELAKRGHDVTILCDTGTTSLVAATGISTLVHEVDQIGFITQWIKQLNENSTPPNPFLEWGTLALGAVRAPVSELSPDVIVSSLFCMGLADLLAEELKIRWCFVNPSFYFGEHSRTTWQEDWYGPFVPRLARECFAPLVRRADMVLHATDPMFDFEPSELPPRHHYVGFLLWEPPHQTPAFLAAPGDPGALVTASTAQPADEETMLRSAVLALSGRPVRTVLTLPKHDPVEVLAPNAVVVGYAPHTPILQESVIAINQSGHGIVSKCLSAGVPMVLLPWDADQPGVAARAEALGVATVVPRANVSLETVSTAVDQVLDDPRYRATGKHVAEILAQRSPADAATSLIEQL